MKSHKKEIFFAMIIFGIIYFIVSYHSEHKKYEIANEIFFDTGYNIERLCERKVDINYNKDLFKDFSSFDQLSVFSQFAKQSFWGNIGINDLKINKIVKDKIKYIDKSKKTKFSLIITNCSGAVQSNGRKISSTIDYYTISLPILSTDNKTAIMKINYDCGMLCGSGGTILFKKINGKWKKIKTINKWIS